MRFYFLKGLGQALMRIPEVMEKRKKAFNNAKYSDSKVMTLIS
jgi:hypothetical protein